MKKFKSKLKKNKPKKEQMAPPSGPQYDTTGNQRLESKFINYGQWQEVISESVSIIQSKYSTSSVELPIIKDDSELESIKALAGLNKKNTINNESNMTHTAQEKAKLMKKHNIRPGTPEWFKLWFSLPYMTGEKPL